MFQGWWQDVVFAVRLLRKSPLFTITAALSLAIGIGANTTIFTVANAFLFRPLAGLASPERLIDLGRTQKGEGFDTVSHHYYRLVRERTTTLDGVYAYNGEPVAMSLGGRDAAERVYGSMVSGSYFPVLGTRAVVGRLLEDRDDGKVGEQAVAVISYELWERRFNRDTALIGQTVLLNGNTFTVVGVTPKGFHGTTMLGADVWVPLSMVVEASPRMSAHMLTEHRVVWLVMGGRLKPGVTVKQAQGEMTAIAAGIEREFHDDYKDRGIAVAASAVVPGRIDLVAGFLGVLMAIVCLVLLIACVNVAGMMLARAAARRREIAVRLAIGAGRARLMRQLMTEALLVFAVGGLIAIPLSGWLTAGLLALVPKIPVPINLDFTPDWRVLMFAVLLSLTAAIVSGLAPALQASRADLVPALKAEGLGSGLSRLRLRNAFVVGQITMSILLVITGGLFLRALQRAATIDPGFTQQNVEVISLDLSVAGMKEAAQSPFTRDLLDRIKALPDVEVATSASDLPLDGSRMGLGDLTLPGPQTAGDRRELSADWNVVEPDFFRTLGIRLIRGRDFNNADTTSSPHVAIVNDAFARKAWPGQDPLGQRLVSTEPDNKTELTVVGVTADARIVSLEGEVPPYIYVAMAQQSISRISLLVKRRAPGSSIPAIRALLREMNPNLPIAESLTLKDATAIERVPQLIAAFVAGTLGLVGLVLAGIGIYGVTAYAVSRQTREIGIRIALGADQSRVLRMVLRQAFVLSAIGVVLGTALASVGSRLIESFLFGVHGLDPIAFGSACLLFVLVTIAASYFPAQRAARVDPISALRAE